MGEGRGRVRVEECHKRVRAIVDGEVVVDTIHPLLVWEGPHYPTYYLPVADVRAKLVASGETEHSPSRGDAELLDIVTSQRTLSKVAKRYADSPLEQLRDTVRIDWPSMDEWLEEDELVYVHARDPYKRVDILASSRHIRVELDGVVLAESRSPRILYETSLPARYYLPLTDLKHDLLRPSETVTHCPYKGAASYWSVQVGDVTHPDLVWCYRSPVAESQKIAGLACFFNERVDIFVDGVLQERPRTEWSRAGGLQRTPR
jgi:uncharacterized protein (DUF427 family)